MTGRAITVIREAMGVTTRQLVDLLDWDTNAVPTADTPSDEISPELLRMVLYGLVMATGPASELPWEMTAKPQAWALVTRAHAVMFHQKTFSFQPDAESVAQAGELLDEALALVAAAQTPDESQTRRTLDEMRELTGSTSDADLVEWVRGTPTAWQGVTVPEPLAPGAIVWLVSGSHPMTVLHHDPADGFYRVAWAVEGRVVEKYLTRACLTTTDPAEALHPLRVVGEAVQDAGGFVPLGEPLGIRIVPCGTQQEQIETLQAQLRETNRRWHDDTVTLADVRVQLADEKASADDDRTRLVAMTEEVHKLRGHLSSARDDCDAMGDRLTAAEGRLACDATRCGSLTPLCE